MTSLVFNDLSPKLKFMNPVTGAASYLHSNRQITFAFIDKNVYYHYNYYYKYYYYNYYCYYNNYYNNNNYYYYYYHLHRLLPGEPGWPNGRALDF
nr:hypothetical protein BaRGS_015199 [Batillaria attramentaria]